MGVAASWGEGDAVAPFCEGACVVEPVRLARPGVARIRGTREVEETFAGLREGGVGEGGVCALGYDDPIEIGVSRRAHLPLRRTYSPLRPPDFFKSRTSPMTTDRSTALTMS